MTHPQLGLFSQFLSQLWTEPWKYHQKEAKEIWGEVHLAYQSFEDRDKFRRALPSSEDPRCDFGAWARYLYLRPSVKETLLVPVVSISSDFEKRPIELRIRAALFLRDGTQTRALAFRFEAPEGEGQGAHDYCHAQFIRTFRGDLRPIPFVPSWVPETQPSFALHANGPVTLLAAFLVSIYGFKQLLTDVLPATRGVLLGELKKYRERVEAVD